MEDRYSMEFQIVMNPITSECSVNNNYNPPGAIVPLEVLVHLEIRRPYQESNPRPSDL